MFGRRSFYVRANIFQQGLGLVIHIKLSSLSLRKIEPEYSYFCLFLLLKTIELIALNIIIAAVNDFC